MNMIVAISTVNKIDKEEFSMYPTTVKQKIPKSLTHSFSSLLKSINLKCIKHHATNFDILYA